MATPISQFAHVVSARLYTTQTQDYLILYTEVKILETLNKLLLVMTNEYAYEYMVCFFKVKKGDHPVLGAKVEVFVTKQGVNGSIHRERFDLLDTGSGGTCSFHTILPIFILMYIISYIRYFR